MAPKKVKSESSSVVKRQRPTIGLKKEMIFKHKNGVHVSDLTAEYMLKSSISTLLKNKEQIKGDNIAEGR